MGQLRNIGLALLLKNYWIIQQRNVRIIELFDEEKWPHPPPPAQRGPPSCMPLYTCVCWLRACKIIREEISLKYLMHLYVKLHRKRSKVSILPYLSRACLNIHTSLLVSR